MTTINNYEDAWAYAMHIGYCTKPGAPGWVAAAQRDMATIEHLVEYMGGGYPCEVKSTQYISPDGYRFPWLSTVCVNGKHGKLFCNLQEWHNPSPDNFKEAPIKYAVVERQSTDETVRYEKMWPNEASRFLERQLNHAEKKHPDCQIQRYTDSNGKVYLGIVTGQYPRSHFFITYERWEGPK